MPDNITPTDQTSPRDAGHTTSENLWTKVTVILGTVIAIAGFLTDAITTILGVIPQGSTAFRVIGTVGTVIALISKISYEISRTLVKRKILDAEIAATKVESKVSPSDAAATVLGGDAPGSGS